METSNTVNKIHKYSELTTFRTHLGNYKCIHLRKETPHVQSQLRFYINILGDGKMKSQFFENICLDENSTFVLCLNDEPIIVFFKYVHSTFKSWERLNLVNNVTVQDSLIADKIRNG